MMNKSDNERSGVFSTAMACLGLYRDPVIARSTSASDFRIADLMNAERPASLYLVVPPSDLARTRPIIRLMLNQIGRRLTESMQFGGKTAYRHRLLLLLDEFPSLGRLDFFESALAYLAGYGMKAFLIAQSLNQLEKAYGPNNSILDNCHVRLTYAANDDKTARRISDMLGQATEKKMQRTYSGSGLWLTNRSEGEHEYARPLLTPSEVTQLPQDEGLLLVGGLPPYRGKKVRYFLDERFRERGGMPAPDSAAEQARESCSGAQPTIGQAFMWRIPPGRRRTGGGQPCPRPARPTIRLRRVGTSREPDSNGPSAPRRPTQTRRPPSVEPLPVGASPTTSATPTPTRPPLPRRGLAPMTANS